MLTRLRRTPFAAQVLLALVVGIGLGRFASFAVPLSATTKMDSCAASYPTLAAIVVAEFFDVPLSITDYLNVAGQALVPTIVAKREAILDLERYRPGRPAADPRRGGRRRRRPAPAGGHRLRSSSADARRSTPVPVGAGASRRSRASDSQAALGAFRRRAVRVVR